MRWVAYPALCGTVAQLTNGVCKSLLAEPGVGWNGEELQAVRLIRVGGRTCQ